MKLLDIFRKGNKGNNKVYISPFANRAERRAHERFTGEKVETKNKPWKHGDKGR